MFDGESDAGPEPDPPTPGVSTRDMVAPGRARYDKIDATKGPTFTGKRQHWGNYEFKAMGFFDNHDLEDTLLGNDEHKDSEDATEREEAQRRNRIVFAALTGMISEKHQEGQTLLTNIRAKFHDKPRDGDKLYEYIKQKMTTMTHTDVSEKKNEIDEYKLLENDTAEDWEYKMVKIKEKWNEIPEDLRGGNERTLSNIVIEKLPNSLSSYKTFVMGVSTANKEFLNNFDEMQEALVDLHRGQRAAKGSKEDKAGSRAFAFATQGGGKGKDCYVCGRTGHLAAACKAKCKDCGMKNCGGVKGKCKVLYGIPPGTNLPDRLRKAIEERAKEMKKSNTPKVMIASAESMSSEWVAFSGSDSEDEASVTEAKAMMSTVEYNNGDEESHKQLLGEALFEKVFVIIPELAKKIVGMFLDGLDVSELENMLDDMSTLQWYIDDALEVLHENERLKIEREKTKHENDGSGDEEDMLELESEDGHSDWQVEEQVVQTNLAEKKTMSDDTASPPWWPAEECPFAALAEEDQFGAETPPPSPPATAEEDVAKPSLQTEYSGAKIDLLSDESDDDVEDETWSGSTYGSGCYSPSYSPPPPSEGYSTFYIDEDQVAHTTHSFEATTLAMEQARAREAEKFSCNRYSPSYSPPPPSEGYDTFYVDENRVAHFTSAYVAATAWQQSQVASMRTTDTTEILPAITNEPPGGGIIAPIASTTRQGDQLDMTFAFNQTLLRDTGPVGEMEDINMSDQGEGRPRRTVTTAWYKGDKEVREVIKYVNKLKREIERIGAERTTLTLAAREAIREVAIRVRFIRRLQFSSIRAIHSVMLGEVFPEKYTTDAKIIQAGKAKNKIYYEWKQRLMPVLSIARDEKRQHLEEKKVSLIDEAAMWRAADEAEVNSLEAAGVITLKAMQIEAEAHTQGELDSVSQNMAGMEIERDEVQVGGAAQALMSLRSSDSSKWCEPPVTRTIMTRSRLRGVPAQRNGSQGFDAAHGGGENQQQTCVAGIAERGERSAISTNLLDLFERADPRAHGQRARRTPKRRKRMTAGWVAPHAWAVSETVADTPPSSPPRPASPMQPPTPWAPSRPKPQPRTPKLCDSPTPMSFPLDVIQPAVETGWWNRAGQFLSTAMTGVVTAAKAVILLVLVATMRMPGVAGCSGTSAAARSRSVRAERVVEQEAMAMMAKAEAGQSRGTVQKRSRTAVIDGGSTHFCWNDVDAFVPSSLVEPDIIRFVRVGEGSRVPVVKVGTIDVWMRGSAGDRVRYTRHGVLYTPDMVRSLIPEMLEWDRYGTRIRKEDVMEMQTTRGVVRLTSRNGLYEVDYKLIHDATGSATALVSPVESSKEQVSSFKCWHARLGHPSAARMRLLPTIATGVDELVVNESVIQTAGVCSTCMECKMHAGTLAATTHHGAGNEGRAHLDVWGPHQYPSAQYHHTCVVGVTTELAGYTVVYPRKSHTAEDLKIVVSWCVSDLAQKGFNLMILRTDNGPEMLSDAFQTFLSERRIGWEQSMPYIHQQLGMQERRWGIVVPMARCMMRAAGMCSNTSRHWASAMVYAAYLVNRLPLSRQGEAPITPYERLTGRRPNLRHLRVYGCDAWVHVPAERRENKMAPVSVRGIFVGLPRNGDGYVVYADGRHYVSKFVRFDESSVLGKATAVSVPSAAPTKLPDTTMGCVGAAVGGVPMTSAGGVIAPVVEHDDAAEVDDVAADVDADGGADGDAGADDDVAAPRMSNMLRELQPEAGTRPRLEGRDSDRGVAEVADTAVEVGAGLRPDGGAFGLRARPGRAEAQALLARAIEFEDVPEDMNDESESRREGELHDDAAYAFISCVHNSKFVLDNSKMREIKIPANHKEAMQSAEKQYWLSAERVEIDTIESMDTYDLVPEQEAIDAGAQILNSKMAYDVKTDECNNLTKWKARGVLVGTRQTKGISFDEIFSATVRFSSIRIILAIATVMAWGLFQFDIKAAYLHAEMDMPVYMKQFEGHEQHGPNGERLVCKLRRALYGSKQGARLWRKRLASWLIAFGFMQCAYDECCYVLNATTGTMLLGVFVDDLVIASSCVKLKKKFAEEMCKEFKVDDRGELKWALGMLVTRNLREGTLTISCEARIEALVERFLQGGSHGKTYATPADKTMLDLKPEPVTKDELKASRRDVQKQETRALIGALIFIASVLRVDVAQAVFRVARHMANPSAAAHSAALRILLYLHATKQLGITYGALKDRSKEGLGRSLHVLVDASWEAGRSVSGVAIMMGGAAVAWVSRRQLMEALSSMDSETYAASLAAADLIHHAGLVEEFGIPILYAVPMWSDNTGTVSVANDAGSVGRGRHLAMRARFLQDCKLSNILQVGYVQTSENAADALTKPLDRSKFIKHRMYLMGLAEENNYEKYQSNGV